MSSMWNAKQHSYDELRDTVIDVLLHLKSLPAETSEDLDIKLNAIQSILRIARNEAGHPSGSNPPSREQDYFNLQIFVPFAILIARLRRDLA